MAFPAFLDIRALFSPTLTDTLLRIAEENAFRPRWPLGGLVELRTVLVREGVPAEKADKRIAAMESAFQDASVAGYEPLIDAMACDPKDRHVLVAAVHARCEVLVPFKLKDFRLGSTESHQISVVSPDAFLLDSPNRASRLSQRRWRQPFARSPSTVDR